MQVRFKKDEYETFYLYPYYSIDYHNRAGLAMEIISFKNNVEPFTDKFVSAFLIALRELPIIKDSCIVTVPSHEINKWSESLLYLAEIVSKELGIINYAHLLQRHRTHEKLTFGGNRSIQSHLDSICINHDMLSNNKNLNVILVDDVTTTGNTLNACVEILKNFGFVNIYKFVVAKTMQGSEFR